MIPQTALSAERSNAGRERLRITAGLVSLCGQGGNHTLRLPPNDSVPDQFSGDGGKTREVNWIATDTRMKDPAGQP